MHRKVLLIFSILSLSFISGHSQDKKKELKPATKDEYKAVNYYYLAQANGDLTAVILHDVFAPPVASRIYAYSNIASYEAIAGVNHLKRSFAGKLTDMPAMPLADSTKKYISAIAGIRAFYAVSKALVFSENDMEEAWQNALNDFPKDGTTKEDIENSIAYGNEIASAIIKWAKKDNYTETRTYPRYQVKNQDQYWSPTSPDYAEALEPYWNKIRPMTLASASQFNAPAPLPYDTNMSSAFMKMVKLVYDSSKFFVADSNRIGIARYWDDNPFTTVYQGHFSFAIKKVTPGGHWIGITSIALKKTNTNIVLAAEAYALVSISLLDAFISCWDTKYTTHYIRPVTIINRLLDPEWKPIIQTPPFPEYTSGHGVISSAAANTLSALFGENFSFTDTIETLNDMPPRTFANFREAAREASFSRYYGGIHYILTAERSLVQGTKVSENLLNKLKSTKRKSENKNNLVEPKQANPKQ